MNQAGILILIGWQTNWAAFIAGGEIFLFVASGAGMWSVDHAVRKN
ncbi:MAG: hypothetical protein ACM339_09485 [Ignavibacteria bacterium]